MLKLSITKFSTVVVLLSCSLVSSIFIYLNYQSRVEFATHQALSNHQKALNDILYRIRGDYSHSQKVINSLLFRYSDKQNLLNQLPSSLLDELSSFLQLDAHVDSIMFVTRNELFWALHQISEKGKDQRFNAVEGSYFVLQRIQGNKEQRRFYDRSMRLIGQQELDATLNFKKRPWYQEAKTSNRLTLIEPYEDWYNKGKVLSLAQQNQHFTVSVDLDSKYLYESLHHDSLQFNTWLFLINSKNEILALQNSKSFLLDDDEIKPWQTWLDSSYQQVRTTSTAELVETLANNEKWYINATPIDPSFDKTTMLVAATKAKYILKPVNKQLYSWLLIVAAAFSFILPFSYIIARLFTRPIRQLDAYAKKMANFEQPPALKTYINVIEIDNLKSSMQGLHYNLSEFFNLLNTLSREADLEHLLDNIAQQSAHIMNAQGCLILLKNDTELKAELLRFKDVKYDLAACQSIPWQTLYQLSHKTKVEGLPESIRTAISVDQCAITQVLVPLINRSNKVIGLQVYLYQKSISEAEVSLTLAKQVANFFGVAIEGRKLVNKQEQLLDAFIQVIAGAIDTKSHYTGQHCQRVPELANEIAMCAGDSELFPHFEFDKTAQRQLSIAAWLHDCGKVTTPEYIVDKATRLETIYNRLHEIRTRFEVKKRDLEITALQQQLKGENKSQTQQQLKQSIAQLEQDYTHVAHCNTKEFVTEEDIERLNTIAAITWQPYFNDRIGLSQEELENVSGYPSTEELGLLMDKPEHRLGGQNLKCDPDKYKLVQPPLRNNLGEIYNLSIKAGTINTEERYAINHHIIQSIEILEKMPFPKHLSRVPEIAGSHHEKLNGTGYPKALCGAQISFEARILAIADVFEALTASDRPYKQAKTLTQALGIMKKMAQSGELDTELLTFFIEQKIPEQYAKRHLKAEQFN